jgi:hypothetical protein
LSTTSNYHAQRHYSISHRCDVDNDNSNNKFSNGPKNGMSYAHGASTTPLMYTTPGGILRAHANTHGDKELFVFPQDNVRKTIGQFMHDVSDICPTSFTHALLLLLRSSNLQVDSYHLDWKEVTVLVYGDRIHMNGCCHSSQRGWRDMYWYGGYFIHA